MKAFSFSNMAAVLSSRPLPWLNRATKTLAITPNRLTAMVVIAGIILAAGMSGSAFAARKVCDDGSYPPCRDTGETTGNRLSYPAVLIPGTDIDVRFNVLEGGLGVTYSYGCEGIETLEQFEYPNTSCVDNLASPTVHYTAAECTATGGKCEGKPVDRIYWQKQEDNDWSAQATGLTGGPVPADFVDWGDSIEVVNWNEYSVLRVETQPFVDLTPELQYGFQMWHVSGQGITEHWGVRTTEVGGWQGLPYIYQSPYAIINGGSADLYLSKLFREAADDPDYACPEMAGEGDPVYPDEYDPDGNGITFPDFTFDGAGWIGACNLPVVDYTLEQSVSGKFVHGYNWRMRELNNPLQLALCGDTTFQKTGWWRLTFVPNGGAEKILFHTNTITNAPELPPIPTPTSALALSAESEDDTDEGSLYTPVVDAAKNLSYIDICIVKKSKGGGGGVGRRNPKP